MGSLPDRSVVDDEPDARTRLALTDPRDSPGRLPLDAGLKRRLEQAVTLGAARKAATTLAAEVEKLLQEELARLLDAFVAKLVPKDPAGSEELGGFLAMVVDDLRRKVRIAAAYCFLVLHVIVSTVWCGWGVAKIV